MAIGPGEKDKDAERRIPAKGRPNGLCCWTPTIGTVAATRVRSREDVLIMRPFPLFLYTRGLASEGPDLLLKKLRGEDID